MEEHDFEGSLILEQLAELDLVDTFLDAVDADDIQRMIALLEKAGVDEASIQVVLQKLGADD